MARLPAGTTYLDGDLLQQQSVYLPGGLEKMPKDTKRASAPGGGEGRGQNRRETVVRKAGGKTWEDPTLLDWDPSEFTSILPGLAPVNL